MRRTSLVPLSLLMIALVSLPALARTSPLSSANGEQSVCPDADPLPVDEQAGAGSPKPAVAAKREAATGKPRRQTAPYRNNEQTQQRTAPRWHRFLPGMFR